jgi:hypothetical protein
MQHARARLGIALALLLATSCSERDQRRTLKIPTNVTRIVVQASDGRVLKQIDSPGGIQRILGFLEAHRKGWRYSDSGFPTPPLELFFYSGDHRLGRFGISCAWYFESDLASEDSVTLRGIDAPYQDVQAFLDLLGMPHFHLEGERCP